MAEAWRIEVSKTAQRSLRALSNKFAAAIVEFVTGPLAENPYRLSKPLHAELAAWRSARRGDYRVILQIDDDKHLVRIGRIEHRATAYKPRCQ